MTSRADETKPSNTLFTFEHKVFRVEGCFFALHPADGEPAFYVRMGAVQVSVPMERLTREFQIASDSPDDRMLTAVRRALRLVKQVRPGDSIPSELIDGTASWTIDPRHFAIAFGRLRLMLISWASGGGTPPTSLDELEQILEDPSTRDRLTRASQLLGEQLGIADPARVLDGLDDVARDLAYIEALREHAGKLRAISAAATRLASVYRSERSVMDVLVRVSALMPIPISEMDKAFSGVEALTRDVADVLRDATRSVSAIRTARDEIRHRLMRWEEIFVDWPENGHQRGDAAEQAIRRLYVFLSRHYRPEVSWSSAPASTRSARH
jgi:hypothetical protein